MSSFITITATPVQGTILNQDLKINQIGATILITGHITISGIQTLKTNNQKPKILLKGLPLGIDNEIQTIAVATINNIQQCESLITYIYPNQEIEMFIWMQTPTPDTIKYTFDTMFMNSLNPL